MRFRFPNLDNFSFLLGVILTSLAWWLTSMLRPAFKQIRANAQQKRAAKKAKAHSFNAVEERYRQSVLYQAQGLHLAAPLFSLDEILVPSRLLAPPHRVEPGDFLYTEDIVETTVPYLPSWPELAAIYKAPTITISEALSENSDIVLVGQTGMGKTVALAGLASSLARRHPEPGLAPETLPFLIHVADLDLPVNKDNPLNPLIDFVAEKSSVFDLSRLPDFIRRVFSEGRALLLLDGTDELTPEGLKDAVEFIRIIKRIYPATRIITTASCEYLDGLVSLNFIPFALAAWNDGQKAEFLEKWGELWARHIATESWAQTSEPVEPLILNGWLNADSGTLTPLELTLKAWGAFAGDLRGPLPIDALETHLRRITPANIPREALESLALQINLAATPIFDPREARKWLKIFEPNEPQPAELANGEEKKIKQTAKSSNPSTPSLGLISKMVDNGLLTAHRNNRMRFVHPIFGGYLAGRSLANYTDTVLQQPPWIGKYMAMHFLAAQGDATTLTNALLAQSDRPLSRNLLVPARWLRDAPARISWCGEVMARLAELLQQTGQPLGLRGQALAAIVLSGNAGSSVLFRQLLLKHDDDLLQMAALGAGALRDGKSIPLLTPLLSNSNSNVRRAACLALSAIGTSPAMDAIANALLHGDEILRRSAAEAMANHPDEGHRMLKEGALMKEDLNVRRAVAYGLGRIDEPWAEELLNKLQTEDDQWIVRNSAQEVLEERQKPNPHVPKRLPPPSESPWLVTFAGKKGEGISPDKPPTDLLLMALKSDDPEERLASLAYLRVMPFEGIFGALYQAMYGGEPELREAVFRIFSEMASTGVKVPDPIQFGVG
jgi:HEAT repeat protein